MWLLLPRNLIIQELAKKDPYWSATVNIVVKVIDWVIKCTSEIFTSFFMFSLQLNSWDEKHIEEPAYEMRLAGFSEAKQVLQNPRQWNVNSVLPILHNAMFFLLQVWQPHTQAFSPRAY